MKNRQYTFVERTASCTIGHSSLQQHCLYLGSNHGVFPREEVGVIGIYLKLMTIGGGGTG